MKCTEADALGGTWSPLYTKVMKQSSSHSFRAVEHHSSASRKVRIPKIAVPILLRRGDYLQSTPRGCLKHVQQMQKRKTL